MRLASGEQGEARDSGPADRCRPANGALALGIGSRALMARAEQQPYFIAAAGAAIGGALVPVPGGVLVQTPAGELIGAVGITGDTSDNDEAAAVDAIEALGLVAVTG